MKKRGAEKGNERAKWYSFKRFWTMGAIMGQEIQGSSNIQDHRYEAERSYELERKNRREGLSKEERKEMLRLIKRFKYTGNENRNLIVWTLTLKD